MTRLFGPSLMHATIFPCEIQALTPNRHRNRWIPNFLSRLVSVNVLPTETQKNDQFRQKMK